MNLPLVRQQRDVPPPPPPPIDAFLDQPTKRAGLYILSAYSFGGLLIGLCIHSFPTFRPVALAAAFMIALILTALTGYPALQENLAARRSRGLLKRIYPGTQGRPRLIDGSVLLAALTPAAALLLLIATGFVIGML